MKNNLIQFHQHSKLFRKYGIQVNKLRAILFHITADHNKTVQGLEIIFVDDEELLQMNRDFLQHNYYTDIITFDLSDVAEQLCGELYISFDRVTDNAATLHSSTKDEILRVCIHGVLHLCGMNDSTAEEKIQMRSAEDTYIDHFKQLI
jgi:rRNA maturation RNase YbeY